MERLPIEIIHNILLGVIGDPQTFGSVAGGRWPTPEEHELHQVVPVGSRLPPQSVRLLKELRLMSRRWTTATEPFLFARCKAIKLRQIFAPGAPFLAIEENCRHLRIRTDLHILTAGGARSNPLGPYRVLRAVHLHHLRPGSFLRFCRALCDVPTLDSVCLDFSEINFGPTWRTDSFTLPAVQTLSLILREGTARPYPPYGLLTLFPSVAELAIVFHAHDKRWRWGPRPLEKFWDGFSGDGSGASSTSTAQAWRRLQVLRLILGHGRVFKLTSLCWLANLRVLQLDRKALLQWFANTRLQGWTATLDHLFVDPLDEGSSESFEAACCTPSRVHSFVEAYPLYVPTKVSIVFPSGKRHLDEWKTWNHRPSIDRSVSRLKSNGIGVELVGFSGTEHDPVVSEDEEG